ncbi:MAG: hypothetical protein JXA60_01710 [Candidatus Coatesbacteria bacterium]|nr:hypothetical protein [Candidatus Coatesbacteria bacterium]
MISIYNLKSLLAETNDNINRILMILEEYEKTKDFIETEFLFQSLIFELNKYLNSDFISIRILEKCRKVIEESYSFRSDFTRKFYNTIAYAKVRSSDFEKARELLNNNSIVSPKSVHEIQQSIIKDGYQDWIRNKEYEWHNIISTSSSLKCFALQYNTLFEKGFAFRLHAKPDLEDKNPKIWSSRLNDLKKIARNILNDKVTEVNEEEHLVFENLPLTVQSQLDLPILFLYLCHIANKSQSVFRLEISQDTLVYGEINEKVEIEDIPLAELSQIVTDEGLRYHTLPSHQKTNIKNLRRNSLLIIKDLNDEILSLKPLNMIIKREGKNNLLIKRLCISMLVTLFLCMIIMLYESLDYLNGGYALNGRILEILDDRGKIVKRIQMNRLYDEKEIIPLGQGNYVLIHIEENRLFLSKNLNDKIYIFNEYDILDNSYYAGGGKLRDSDLIYLKFYERSTDRNKPETFFYLLPASKFTIMKPLRIGKEGHEMTSSPYELKNCRMELVE